MNTTRLRVAAVCLGIFSLVGGKAHAQAFGPTAYLRASDSPFNALSFSYFYRESFEDHLLNTPGISGSPGGVASVVFGPSIHDSVDEDDGAVDGSGLGGDSWFNSGGSVTFSFSLAALGTLPSHAGLVWTDGPGSTNVRFQAYGPDNLTLVCDFTGSGFADNSVSGQTAEDRFFGCGNAGGISKITVTNGSGGGIELDHVQYGLAQTSTVPEPSSLALIGVGLSLVFVARRRRVTK
jgi:hypothetical protein